MNKTKLAVFDIDGTIFRSSLIIELVNLLVEKQVFPKGLNKEIEEDYIAWANRQGSYDNYISKVVEAYIKYIKGTKESVVRQTAREIIEYQKNKVYIFTRELLKRLKSENYYLLAISGAPEIIVAEFAKTLGFDKYYGARYEVISGKFSGQIVNDTAWNKHEILSQFVKDNKQFNLKDAVGVGDSEIDITFLDIVGNPIAFNPDFKLATYAKKKKCRIVVERKNVVYDIKDFDFEITS
nr:HAD family phosphatase [Candidatus Levybacteria bacterium]